MLWCIKNAGSRAAIVTLKWVTESSTLALVLAILPIVGCACWEGAAISSKGGESERAAVFQLDDVVTGRT